MGEKTLDKLNNIHKAIGFVFIYISKPIRSMRI